MQVTVTPTAELTMIRMGFAQVEVRRWRGTTDQGTPIEMYVLCAVQLDDPESEQLKKELPDFMTNRSAGWLRGFNSSTGVLLHLDEDSPTRK